MDPNFSWLNSPITKLALAGALGGVVRWATLKQPPFDGLISVVVGCICAIYVGPAINPIMRPVIDLAGIDLEAAQGLGGFLVGIGGILVSGFFLDLWQLRRRLLKQGGSTDGPK